MYIPEYVTTCIYISVLTIGWRVFSYLCLLAVIIALGKSVSAYLKFTDYAWGELSRRSYQE